MTATVHIGKLMNLGSLSRITCGICPSVDMYVEMEKKEATQPPRNAGTMLLKKISLIDTRMKQAII